MDWADIEAESIVSDNGPKSDGYDPGALKTAIVTALRDAEKRGAEKMRQSAAMLCLMPRSQVMFHAGEMSAEEWRTVKALLAFLEGRIRAIPTMPANQAPPAMRRRRKM